MNDNEQRLSTVDGFTIVYRTDRSPRVHLLRPYNQCNTEKSKAGRDTVRVEGGREHLMAVLEGKRAIECKLCFPRPKEATPRTIEEKYAPEDPDMFGLERADA